MKTWRLDANERCLRSTENSRVSKDVDALCELIIRITFKVSSKKTLNRVRPQVWNFNNPPCKTFVREQQ